MKSLTGFWVKIWIVISLIAVSGCSAPWHLRQALQKDPEILDVKADTSQMTRYFYTDTTIYFGKKVPVKIYSDTGAITRVIEKPVIQHQDPLEVSSSDGIAHARAWVDDAGFHLKTWAMKDTLLHLQDSLAVRVKHQQKLQTIIKAKKAEIKQVESFAKQLQRWIVIIASVLGILVCLWCISKVWNLFKEKRRNIF